MLSQSFRNGLKSVHRSESGTWNWKVIKKNIYCTLLVPICSSHKEEYDGILVCTPIVNEYRQKVIYIGVYMYKGRLKSVC